MTYKEFFRNKKIAVIGLGPHGEMMADIKFLIKAGADVFLYDIRSENRLQGFIGTLTEAGLTQMSLGKVSAEKLTEAELIILSPEISRRSFFLKKAQEAKVRIEYADVLFLKMAPVITLIGIMGMYGKSTVAHMLYTMLKLSFSEYDGQGLYFIDSDLPHGALTHLKKIKAGDVVLARITEDMLHEYHSARVSPAVAVITSPLPSYSIVEHQTYNNFIVAPNHVIDAIKQLPNFASKAKMLRTKDTNIALATQAAELFKVSGDVTSKVSEEFSGLKGHQEFVKKTGGVEFYNDAASITPLSTLAALKKLAERRNIILILGGAYTGHDYSELVKHIPTYAHTTILLPGSGSIGFRSELEQLEDVAFIQSPTLEEAVVIAQGCAKKGDRVVLSPGCEAIGVHISRKERGEKFVKAVRAL